jgi:hypothetical protein
MRNTTWMLMMALAMTLGAVGCGSDDDTNLPVAPPIDTAPPVLPSGLAVAYDPTTFAVTVTWDENTTDVDLAGFLVSRTVVGTTEELVDTPIAATEFVDNIQGSGFKATYSVAAVDESGNVSAAVSAEVQIEAPTNPIPLPIEL